MCQNNRPDLKAFWENLKMPMPVARKIRLYFRNNVTV